SDATNLVPGDTNGSPDVFIRDRHTGETTRVSLTSSGNQANKDSGTPIISGDGRYVGFVSQASNLVPRDTNGVYDIFVHDRQTGQTTRVSVASGGAQFNVHSFLPTLSWDGRYVAFLSLDAAKSIYAHDRQTGQTTKVSVPNGGEEANNESN